MISEESQGVNLLSREGNSQTGHMMTSLLKNLPVWKVTILAIILCASRRFHVPCVWSLVRHILIFSANVHLGHSSESFFGLRPA